MNPNITEDKVEYHTLFQTVYMSIQSFKDIDISVNEKSKYTCWEPNKVISIQDVQAPNVRS